MTPHPIDTMPTDIAEEDLALLFCPEQGGWYTAVFFERRWVDFATMTLDLEPTHWLPLPPDPKDDEPSPERIVPWDPEE